MRSQDSQKNASTQIKARNVFFSAPPVRVIARSGGAHRIKSCAGHFPVQLRPGFVIVWGLSWHFPIIASWLAGPSQNAPTVGDLFYATLASVACGMFANMARWAILDTINHHTGVRLPVWDFSRLHERLAAYELLVEFHYRFYQFGANALIALLFTYIAYRATPRGWAYQWGTMDIGFVLVCVILFLGSRDALRKYYRRAGALLHAR